METDGIVGSFNYDNLLVFRLVLDTAAMVLIWLVQLVIYPAFLHFRNEDFKRWHLIYTRRVTYVVMPVMLGQLALYGWLLWTGRTWDVVLNGLLILLVWGVTFFRAVPLHGALDVEEDHLPLATRLLTVNWWRTGIWTAVWAVSLMYFF